MAAQSEPVGERERRARFLVVASGGFLGLGETKRPVPVDAVTAGDRDDHVGPSRAEVHWTVECDSEIEPWPDVESIYGQHGCPPLWAPDTSAPPSCDAHDAC